MLTKDDKIYYADVNTYLGIRVDAKILPKTLELEKQGVFVWLKTIFPAAFEEDFSVQHRQFWELFWSVLMRIREQKKYDILAMQIPKEYLIESHEYTILLILGRGLGKSMTLEASSVMRGAILSGGYCLYISESQDQADEHNGNCKILIESPESRLLEYYPPMAVADVATIEGVRAKDRIDIFITESGWICRSKGMNSKLRGLRIGNRRPDDINLDDIDSVNDTPDVSYKKLRQLTASVIPTQARRYTTIKFGQNLITETGVINQIYTGKSDALAERTTVGVQNTFTHLEYETYLDETDGRVRHRILPESVPSWSGVDLPQAQKFLNDSGLETFLAEYQNEFEHLRTGRVFHEYDESRHLICWSDFQRLFGVRHIPAHWQSKVAADIGYSNESLSAWLFVATSATNSPLPNHYFAYRGATFRQKSIDEQAEALWEMMFPQPATGKTHFEATTSFTEYPELFRLLDTKPQCKPFLDSYVYNQRTDSYQKQLSAGDTRPIVAYSPEGTNQDDAMYHVNRAELSFSGQIVQWTISHEKTGEQKTLAQKYGIPARKTTRFGADDGVAEANHLLRGDYTRPHPFHDDIQNENGLWQLGCPYVFFIVDDDEVPNPKTDAGMKIFRDQIAGQRWTQEKLTATGLTRSIPLKFNSDACLVAGTLITTKRGAVPIEQIKKGDLILTRKGYRKCLAAGMTNPSAETFTLQTEDGTELEGTGNHPVWTEEKGFIDLCLMTDAYRMVQLQTHQQNKGAGVYPKPVKVVTLRKNDTTKSVYNLSVEGVPEYFANGLLVHNCDALRMWAVDYALPNPTPLTMVEEFNRLLPESAKVKKGDIITLEQHMSNQLQEELAAEALAEKYGLNDDEEEDYYY